MQTARKAARSALPTGGLCAALLMMGTLPVWGDPDQSPQQQQQTAVSDTVVRCGDEEPDPSGRDVTIGIVFKQSQGVWCPEKATAPCPTVYKRHNVTWQSMQEVDGELQSLKTNFSVYFSPVRGHSISSNDNGTVQRPVDPNSPSGIYKYTVWDDPQGNDPHRCAPLDPNYFVR
jgi:hypothetical protein